MELVIHHVAKIKVSEIEKSKAKGKGCWRTIVIEEGTSPLGGGGGEIEIALFGTEEALGIVGES